MSRAAIPDAQWKVVLANSGGVCAFPHCGRRLVADEQADDRATVTGQIAHIVAESRQGPRGVDEMSDGERNNSSNLLLLCGDHHKSVDAQPRTYTVAVLRQMKADHESRMRRGNPIVAATDSLITETVHSTLMGVSHLPDAVFSAPCAYSDEAAVKDRIRYPEDEWELAPFVVADGRLFAFHDLRVDGNPFANVIDMRNPRPSRAEDMWKNSDGKRRYVMLLNRALYKYAGRLGVRYDPPHHRFFFTVEKRGVERTVTYRSVSGRQSTRKVVYEPRRRATNMPVGFWWHLGVALRFHQMSEKQWCLSIRPERHLTSDSETPLPAQKIGRRVTRLKARMYNAPYLAEVNFWREYLSRGKQNIILNFGNQVAIVSSELLNATIRWPGIPGDEKKVAAQPEDEEDLFDVPWLAEGEKLDWEEIDAEEEDEDESSSA